MQTTALQCIEIDVTPTITASSAYSAGNQVGGIQTLSHAGIEQNRFSQLQNVTVVDIDGQKAPLTIALFSVSPTLAGSDHAAFSMTAANLKSQCIGTIPVTAAQYLSTGTGMAVATVEFANAFFQTLDPASNIYAVAITTGTPTYTTTSSLVFKWVFSRHF